MEDKALGLLGLMRRARAVEPGTDGACDAVKEGKAKLLLISADISDTARRKAENAANGRRVLVQPVQYTKAELGSAFGMAECSMAAVKDIGFANALAKILADKDAERYGALSAELEKRNQKAVRRKREKTQCADSKRNGKRRTEV